MSGTMAAQSSLYNEDRNLLRIREKERRNQEAHQERECFLENAPLFAEPYKTKKGDELSSRIQSMLGNYEEVKEYISTKAPQPLFGMPKSTVPLTQTSNSDRAVLSEKSGSMSRLPFQKPMGPPHCGPSSGNSTGQHRKAHPGKEQAPGLHDKSYSLSQGRSQSRSLGQSHCDQEVRSSHTYKKNDRNVDGNSCSEEEFSSPSKLSPLLSSLASPLEPLSPIHSNQHVSSRLQNNKSRGNVYHHQTKTSPAMDSSDSEARDNAGSAANMIAMSTQLSSQNFPAPLPSKTSAMQQKPTAYVRPMDGQDQAPSTSPDLKPLTEDYHGQTYGNIANLKANAKAKLSKLKISSDPLEQTFSNEVHCVEDILKESQQISSVKKTHKQYDTTSMALPSPQQGTSLLEDDLHISDSEESEPDQVSEKEPLSSAPPSALQSQPDSVASAHSSSAESESTSESDSSTDSESESSSSDGEGKKPPLASTPKPNPPTSNTWQLNNFMSKANQSTALADHQTEEDHDEENHEESKVEVKCTSTSYELSGPKEEPALQKAPQTSQEGHHTSKKSGQKSPAVQEAPMPRQTVGTKQPRKPGKALVPEQPKGGLQVESEPAPYGTKEQPSKEKPKVKTKVKTGDKEPKPIDLLSSEKKKHKSSHQTTSKPLSDSRPEKTHVARVHVELSGGPQSHKQNTAHNRTSDSKSTVVIREETHRDKVQLPNRDNKLSSQKENHISETLIVKIELSLLSRIPQKGSHQKKNKLESKEPSIRPKLDSAKKSAEASLKVPQKRKGEEELKHSEKKRIKVDKESKSSSSTSQKESTKTKLSKPSSECPKKELPTPEPMSPTQNSQKPENAAHKRKSTGSNTSSQQSAEQTDIGPVKSKSSHKESIPSKHTKVEGKPSGLLKSNKGSVECNTNPFPVPSLPNGSSKPTRPLLKFDEKPYPAEHYLKEAKKLKHRADVLSDKVGKSYNYLDAALYFIECGTAMEPDTPAPKSAYTMFVETVDLIKYIMKSKNFSENKSTSIEEIFSAMCMRCQSLLYLMMFRHKKDTAIKYSRTLSEHFKSSSRAAQAPSPCVARSTGTPSPLSPTPSPASSAGSQPGSNASNTNSGVNNNSVSIPHMIHQIASSYVNITSYFVHAYEIWEKADKLVKKNKEFFAELNAAVCPLALNSSMTELVHYTRQGLQWLRLESNAP
ncbi:AF4/FMR2 family member 1 isoform X2 [Ambystoma mexicanum]|uniref:AF4/FMR2 family member 1 isoform X2 n=1 Tax=Ambystoma mexicanum TaxID=8296 RepID=UPI0037E782A2